MFLDPQSMAAFVAVFFILSLLLVLPLIAIYVATSFFLGKTFEKMGVQKSLAWVPIRNAWIWLERGGYQGAFALLPLAAAVDFTGGILTLAANLGFVTVMVLASMRLVPKFGKSKEYAYLVIIPPVLFGILGSRNTTYTP